MTGSIAAGGLSHAAAQSRPAGAPGLPPRGHAPTHRMPPRAFTASFARIPKGKYLIRRPRPSDQSVIPGPILGPHGLVGPHGSIIDPDGEPARPLTSNLSHRRAKNINPAEPVLVQLGATAQRPSQRSCQTPAGQTMSARANGRRDESNQGGAATTTRDYFTLRCARAPSNASQLIPLHTTPFQEDTVGTQVPAQARKHK